MVLRLAPTVGVVSLMLLMGLVFPALHSPAALAYATVVALALTQLEDRPVALGLAGLAVVALAFALWLGAQPGYVQPI